MTHTRRSFIASLVALPFIGKVLVAKFQKLYPPTVPIGGTYTIIVNGRTSEPIPYNATREEYLRVYNSLRR